MKIRNTIYLWVGLLAAFSGNAFGFSVTPTIASGYEGDTIQLSINVTDIDWILDSNSAYCGSGEYQFVIDMQQLSGNATWSDNAISGDFHLDSGGAPYPQQNPIVFCTSEFTSISTFQGYSLNLHADSVEFEGDETAQIRFTGQCNDGNSIAMPCPSDVSLTIFDTTEVLYTATIEATIANAAEPDVDGLFTILLDKPAGPGGLNIFYELSANSTATSGEDFEDLGYSLFIQEGQTSATLPVVVRDDDQVEGDETVIVDLVPDGFELGAPSSAAVTIRDDDSLPAVSVAAMRAAEPGPPVGYNGKFIFTLDQPAPANGLTVNFSILESSTATPGEDYETLGTSVDFPAGVDEVEVAVAVMEDDLDERLESVILEIQESYNYDIQPPGTATVWIINSYSTPTVSISVAASDAAEPASNGKFTFSSGSPAPQGGITVNFVVSAASTATQAVDYEQLPTSVTIAAGSSSVDVPVVVIDDDIVEGPETVVVEIQESDNYDLGSPVSATVTIADDDSAGLLVSASSLTTGEDGTADQFSVSLATKPDADVIINITSSHPAEGIAEPASLLFNTNNWSSPQLVTVTGLDDDVVDGDVEYSVTLTISSADSNYASLAPVVIRATNYDNDVASPVSFPQATISVKEDVGVAEVTIERTGSSGNSQAVAKAGTLSGKQSIERLGTSSAELTVTFSTDDHNPRTTATPGQDYTPVNEVLVWPAGDYAPKTVNIEIINDMIVEDDVTIVLKLEVAGSNSPPVYADLVVSDDFVEDVISSINPEDLPPNLQSITDVILTSCPTGLGQGGFQELCTDLVVEALEGGSIRNPLQQVTPDEASAARTPATQTQTVQNINVTGRQSALRGGATGLSMQGFSVNMAGFNMTPGMFRNFGTGYDSIQANATNPFATNYLGNSLVSNKANATDDAMDDFGNWGIWVSGKAIIGDKDATDREQGFDFDTAGLTVGVDYRFTDKLVAGAAFGYANNSIKVDSKGGKLDTTGLTGTIYGSYYPTANFYLDASLSLGNNDYKQNRNIVYQLNQIGASVAEELRADYDGDQTGITFGTGYDFNKNGWVFGPTLFVEYVDISVDAYDEKLISSSTPGFTLGWATHINKQKYESLIPQLGVQLSKAFSQSWGVIVPTAHVSWARELKSDNSIVSGYFLGDTGQVNFSLLTDALDEDFFKAGVGLSAMFQNNKSAFLSVDGDFGRDLLSVYYINAGFRWEF